MNFGQPLWILIGAICSITLYFIIVQMQKRRVQALENFAAKSLMGNLTRNVSQRKRRIKIFLYTAAFFTCFVALARPQYGYHWVDVKRKGIDILFAIDTSTSMLAEDIRPNRLDRSKFAILDFVSQLEGDRIGLMPFAGSAFLMCPLTIDYSAFEQSLQSIDTKIIPNPGTNLAEAIEHGESVLKNDANFKLLIIITDGENLQGDTLQAATDAAEKGMTIFTVGVGTAAGELIPINVDGKQGFIKDNDGKFVTSKLDETTLREIAEKTNGLYVPLGNKGQGLETIYQQKLTLIPKEDIAEKRHKIPIERFQWPLAAALILLVLEYLINSRKTAPFSFSLKRIKGKSTPLLLVLAAPLLFRPVFTHASPGEEAYSEGDYLTASEYYLKAIEKEPENTALHYNYGTVAYKNNMYDDAIASFNKSLGNDDLLLQEKAYYNRGNAQYKKGTESQQADPQKTINSWQDALTSFESCLQLNPKNQEASFNKELVEKKLEELKKQEKDKQQGDQQQDSNEQDQQEDNQQNEQNEQNQQGEQDKQGEQQDSGQKPEEQQGKDQTPQDNPAEEQQEEEQSAQQQDAEENSEEEIQPNSGDSETPEENQEPQQAMLGKMSKEEAEQLLNELKNEEGNLNFIPSRIKQPENNNGRDW